jgi:tetrahydromethanopterin S-methyltransferase subunit F
VIEILNNNAYKFISGQLNIDDAKDRTELIARNESKVSGMANRASPFKFK